MSISRYSVRAKAKQIAQDGGPGNTTTGVQLLLTDTTDYDVSILQALRILSQDKPNLRVVDSVLTTAGFRQVLFGASPMPGLTGANAWVDGASSLRSVFHPWDTTLQGLEPIDSNHWRTVQDPAAVVLEFLNVTPDVGETVRLTFTRPHTLTEQPNTVPAPAAPTVSLASPAAPGNCDNGSHLVEATYLTADGETDPSTAVSVNVVDKTVNGQIKVIVAASGVTGVTGVRVFMTVSGGLGNKKLAGSLATDGGTVTINLADAGLGVDAPSTNTAGGSNTVKDGDEDALAILAGSIILELAAVKAAQNTGNTGLPNDVVDRRTQSDIFRSRSKELREMYNTLVGKGPKSDVTPASGFKDLDVSPSWGGTGGRFLTHNER